MAWKRWRRHLPRLPLAPAQVHYLFWWPAMLTAFAFMHFVLDVWWAKWVCVAFHAVYFPLAFDGTERKTGKGWDLARMAKYWLAAHDYAMLEVRRTAKLDPSRQYFFAWFPHAILVLSRISVYGGIFERLFPGVQHRTLGATPMFYFPFCRDFSMWMGAVDAGKRTAAKVLQAGYSLMVFPGGSREIFTTDPNSTDVTFVLNCRKGFVKLALKHGVDLVPVVVYGEKFVYSRWLAPDWLVNFCLKAFRGMPMLIFWGRFFTLLPYRTPMRVVYGAPIRVDAVEDPTQEQIDELHAAYGEALQKLWHEHKVWGYGSKEVADKETLIIK